MDLSCNICTETFFNSKDIVCCPCGHIFHQVCLEKWLNKSKTCPDCRDKCQTRQMFQLFLTFDSELMGTVLTSKLQKHREEVEKTKKDINEKISKIITTQNLLDVQKESQMKILSQLKLKQDGNQKLSKKIKSLKEKKNCWTLSTFENMGKITIVGCLLYLIFSVSF